MRTGSILVMMALTLIVGISPAHAKIFLSTASTAVLALGTVNATALGTTGTTFDIAAKQALALAAIEDAAHFYQAGELVGVLPPVLARMREIDAELATAQDSELVDAVVEAADSTLN